MTLPWTTSHKTCRLLTFFLMTLVVILHDNNSAAAFNSEQAGTGNGTCELVYQEYLKVVENFTHCELEHAKPFRLCIGCSEQYEMANAVYANLTQEPEHEECKVKYFQSDRIQIIPTVQANMQNIWNKANCAQCYSYDQNGWESGKVNYNEDVVKFLELYDNFSVCVNGTSQDDLDTLWTYDGNVSSKCKTCYRSYALLNDYYNNMYASNGGDVCMDLMDRMNYTRRLWSIQLRCTHRSGDHDAMPVIIISCIVACMPIMFYISVRATGKVTHKELFRQKRLTTSQDTSRDSHSLYGSARGAGGDMGTFRRL